MSTTSAIRTALSDLIEANLTGYIKLPDSLDTPDNPVLQLEKGYSVGIGAALNVSDVICPGTVRVERTFNIVLTNVYSPDLSADYRETLENNLSNDVDTMVAAIELNNVLGGLAMNSTYADDTGIEYLSTDAKQFIITILTVTVDYFQ